VIANAVGLNFQVDDIDNQMFPAKAAGQDLSPFHDAAVEAVRSAPGQVTAIHATYVEAVRKARTEMTAAGYQPEVIDSVDAVPGGAATEAADRYDKSGERARDQALVDKARAQGRTHYLANDAGLPGNMTAEEAAATQRLKDYAAITDPAARYDPREAAQGRRLADERLDGYNKSKVIGPLSTDTVLGGMPAPARRPGSNCSMTWNKVRSSGTPDL
jgi:hypothetical protein